MPYKDKERRLEYLKQRYLRNKENGLCTKCGKPAVHGYIRCAGCMFKESIGFKKWYSNPQNREKRRIYYQQFRQRRIDNNQCVYCGTPLMEGEGRGCFACKVDKHSVVSIPTKKEV